MDFFDLNYTPKLSRLKSQLQVWYQRDLTPFGKITLVKTFALSQLVFLLSVLPNPPLSFLKVVEKTIFNFIWNGKPDKVRRTTLCLPTHLGGLNMINIYHFIDAIKISWVKRYNDNLFRPWKVFFDFHL